ncbi:unnamed protein product [Polarella glacialis]|uniref:Phospholipase B-like n=1 Tax=Polarella glacialis TaxID=89957 RepID=A0A813K6G4_POLGL|nr:unnamed protein product [Polarella glacialis]CAE8693808.1 unnamed protein product [Polarella glacialis]
MTSQLVMFCMAFLVWGVQGHGPEYAQSCENRTWTLDGGDLEVMSWHIHYMENVSDFARFREEFTAHFRHLFPANGSAFGTHCPFGPNYGSTTYPHMCSVHESLCRGSCSSPGNCTVSASSMCPFSAPQDHFSIPVQHVSEAWEFAQKIQGSVSLMLHAITGCMRDDHFKRIKWLPLPGQPAPFIENDGLGFPCNRPGTGCNDSAVEPNGPPQCGCTNDLPHTDPSQSCKNCIPMLVGAGQSDAFVLSCTDAPLKAFYGVRGLNLHSGELKCGNMFRALDLQVPPNITHRRATEGAYYVLVMLSIPGVSSSSKMLAQGGLTGQWIVGNIASADLRAGNFEHAMTVSPYSPPDNKAGTVTSVLLLFEQPAGPIEFQLPTSLAGDATTGEAWDPDSWNYRGFLRRHGVGTSPLATNWFAAYPSDVRR